MRKRAVLVIALVTPVLMFALPRATGAEEEGSFFLQDEGSVRVMRGLDSDQNFEAATVPDEADAAPQAAPPPEAAPPQPGAEPELTTRERALRRARERGIPVNRAGVRPATGPEVDSTRDKAIERSRDRGIPVNRAGG